ncbi:MAG: glycoside hydrolase family 16 protein [Clostridiales bacterium]|nr:glycoside hydrolase family 16 protein [Clostridiales bacterium]
MRVRFAAILPIAVGLLLFGCAAPPADESPEAVSPPSPAFTAVPEATPVLTPTPSPTSVPTPAPTPTPGPPEGYELRFADEFSEAQINETIWGFELGPWPYNREQESYTRENAWIEDGALVIEARKEPSQRRDYTSARLTTQGKLDFIYGYLEVRAATPTGRGVWSAIWLLPSDLRYGGYLHSGEIDIAERVGYDAKRVHATIHTYQNNSVSDNAITAFSNIGRKDDRYHVYGILWDEAMLRIYLDGSEVLSYARPDDASPDTWPFDVPFHLILNLAVGGSWGGAKGVDDEAFPQRMTIDYVRYYTKAAQGESAS